ncbi:endopeptidase La [Calorimonas adulescens]|uniref:Lon protease n=1 Tax=Calorimonas adulescens TaxID=2606906 RepID=A0A5D8QEP5_9THEO|nr:endopeptidase La [Calorimonas adulescens]TZE81718.1 endopeptidase La [Calorimonas adulescens]
MRYRLPVIPLRGVVVFPYVVINFDVGRKKSIMALDEAMANNQEVFLCAQKDPELDEPGIEDIYTVGTVARVKQVLKLPGDIVRVMAEGVNRGRIVSITKNEPFIEGEIENIVEVHREKDKEMEALMRSILKNFETYQEYLNHIAPYTVFSLYSIEDPYRFSDMVASNLNIKAEDQQRLLEMSDVKERLEEILRILTRELDILEMEKKINDEVKSSIDKVQRDYYLREQLRAIKQELGEEPEERDEIDEYREKLESIVLPDEVKEKAFKELGRLEKMSYGSPEAPVIRTYLDWILDLPWSISTTDRLDIKEAKKILDKDHYGLAKVKDRILEFLAVRKLTNHMKGPILCFVGPPGVGKTSLGMSIARAMNRKFVRMSLGGIRDEAEIRGHRRTYVGALPGRIINGLKLAGSNNPVFLLDEIDKLGTDFRGDPASALLEVLDPEQNSNFRDHYLELPFDLSNVLFITTANTIDTIPSPLLDRMEVISIPGYTDEEKVQIALRYLLPKQLEANGLKKDQINFTEGAVRRIINEYTREAGVRNLERTIAAVLRKVARKIVEESVKSIRVTAQNIETYLGVPQFKYEKMDEMDRVGVVRGLAYTTAGGDTLSIETIIMPGKGNLILTGQLGDVMKESAQAGLSYIRSKCEELGLPSDFYKNVDIHIHVPEGAIPKDGPSAGISMTTAMISALTKKPVSKDIAMTGEITLTGRILPIGGVKEKVLAAHRAGIKRVILPFENKKDLEDIPASVRKDITFYFVKTMDEVIKLSVVSRK